MTKEYTDLILETMNDKFQQMLECFSTLDAKIDRVEERLTDKIDLVDAKVMGLAKRVDHVEERLSREIAEVRSDLADHRNNTEMHRVAKKRTLKKVA
jgi:uncharacterized protein YdcH (DUF465 family)